MVIYKAFKQGLKCREYQFVLGMNETDKANCVQNGFHGAENPIDCFRHYPPSVDGTDEYYMCEALGDIDEDNVDSKVSCTKLNIIRKLSMYDMATCALLFVKKNPGREIREYHNKVVSVGRDKEECISKGIAIAVGYQPQAKGGIWSTLGFVRTDVEGHVKEVRVALIDGVNVLPNRYYTLGEEGLYEVQGYRCH